MMFYVSSTVLINNQVLRVYVVTSHYQLNVICRDSYPSILTIVVIATLNDTTRIKHLKVCSDFDKSFRKRHECLKTICIGLILQYR